MLYCRVQQMQAQYRCLAKLIEGRGPNADRAISTYCGDTVTIDERIVSGARKAILR